MPEKKKSLIEPSEIKVWMQEYERCYAPINDPELMKLGIEVCAKVSIEEGKIHNEVIFKRGSKTAEVKCIHTNLCQIIPDQDSEFGFKTITVSAGEHPELSEEIGLEQSFISLKSFVENVTETGLKNIIESSVEHKVVESEEYPLLGDQLREEVSSALIEIAPDVMKDKVLELLEKLSFDEDRFYEMSKSFEEAICKYFTVADIRKLDAMSYGIDILDLKLRICIAENPELPEELMLKLVKDRDFEVRWALSRNPNLPKEQMSKFVKDTNDEIRKGIAGNPSLLKELMLKLAEDEIWGVRSFLARNPSLLKELMLKLAEDKDYAVRMSLAQNPNLTEEVMLKLSKDTKNSVREKLIQNPYIPKYIKDKIKI